MRADRRKVEQAGHEVAVDRHGIDDPHLCRADKSLAEMIDVHIRRFDGLVALDHLAVGENGLGDLFRGRAAGGNIVFDAEIGVGAARIVARRKHDAAEGFFVADHRRRGGGGQNSGAPDDDFAKPVGDRHFQNDLDGLAIEVTAVAADHQRLALKPFQRRKDRLDEIGEIVRLLENLGFLAQAGRARTLVIERSWWQRS